MAMQQFQTLWQACVDVILGSGHRHCLVVFKQPTSKSRIWFNRPSMLTLRLAVFETDGARQMQQLENRRIFGQL